MFTRLLFTFALIFGMALWTTSCAPSEPNQLDQLTAFDLSLKGEAFKLWVVDDDDERERGLMFITAEQMTPLPDGTRRGMLFVFDHEQHLSFWMKNTIIPLDIAYLDSDGTVLTTYTMAALDDRFNQYPSRFPARYAIEVNANVFGTLGLRTGDRIDLPGNVR